MCGAILALHNKGHNFMRWEAPCISHYLGDTDKTAEAPLAPCQASWLPEACDY